MKAFDLLINIASMNIVAFVIKDLKPGKTNTEYMDNLINERKENIVQFILNALRIPQELSKTY